MIKFGVSAAAQPGPGQGAGNRRRRGQGVHHRGHPPSLGAKAGVPQSHISKIENGTVDLRASSLVELARALDLELVLVPRRTLPAVHAVAHARPTGDDTETARPAYSLDEDDRG